MSMWSKRKEPDYDMLVQMIRTEIERGVGPLKADMTSMAAAIARVEVQQAAMYNRETIDLMFRERDSTIERAHLLAEESHAALGSLWQQTFIKAGVVVTVIFQLAQLLHIVKF